MVGGAAERVSRPLSALGSGEALILRLIIRKRVDTTAIYTGLPVMLGQ